MTANDLCKSRVITKLSLVTARGVFMLGCNSLNLHPAGIIKSHSCTYIYGISLFWQKTLGRQCRKTTRTAQPVMEEVRAVQSSVHLHGMSQAMPFGSACSSANAALDGQSEPSRRQERKNPSFLVFSLPSHSPIHAHTTIHHSLYDPKISPSLISPFNNEYNH